MHEYKKKCACFHDRLNESVLLINAFSDEAADSRKENIMQTAQKACAMIKENNEEFYEFQKDWDLMNDLMKRKNKVLDSLSEKGVTVCSVIPSSLYFLLEAESVEKLDRFWEEYKEGTLTNEFQQKLFSCSHVDLTVLITEDNYMRYRVYLGKDHILYFCRYLFCSAVQQFVVLTSQLLCPVPTVANLENNEIRAGANEHSYLIIVR